MCGTMRTDLRIVSNGYNIPFEGLHTKKRTTKNHWVNQEFPNAPAVVMESPLSIEEW